MASKKKILIVEDTDLMRHALAGKMESGGFEVIEAVDGIDGLKKYKKHKPDLIILDIIMPRMDGLTLLKEIRKVGAGVKTPIIILSNLESGEKVDQAMNEGVYDFLIKAHWSLADVLHKVKERLNML